MGGVEAGLRLELAGVPETVRKWAENRGFRSFGQYELASFRNNDAVIRSGI